MAENALNYVVYDGFKLVPNRILESNITVIGEVNAIRIRDSGGEQFMMVYNDATSLREYIASFGITEDKLPRGIANIMKGALASVRNAFVWLKVR
jgi:hypothetical protein